MEQKIKTIKRINFVLFILIILANFSIIFLPLIPEVTYAVSNISNDPNKTILKYDIDIDAAALDEINLFTDLYVDKTNIQEKPKSNTLYIPKINFDGEIFESDNPDGLENGAWRRPETSTPDQGSNTVIVAHRFGYFTGIDDFYHLDKLEVGDLIFVFWNEKEYIYKVFLDTEVLPSATSIEDESDESILTLYTCAPLYTWDKRLVIKAKLINE